MKFTRASWSDRAEAFLSRALVYSSDMQYVRDEVVDGRAELWIGSDGSHLVTRVEGAECVIVAFEGFRAREKFKTLWRHLKARGFETIRIHTQQLWLVRMLQDFNPEPVEHVVRFFINGRKEQKRNQNIYSHQHDERTGHRHH